MLTRVAPGRYKMVTKTKTGKTGDFEMNFTEHGVFETMTVGGLSASCFYRYLLKFSNNRNDQNTNSLSIFTHNCHPNHSPQKETWRFRGNLEGVL